MVEVGHRLQAAEEAELAYPAPGPDDPQRVAQHAVPHQVEDPVDLRPEFADLGGELPVVDQDQRGADAAQQVSPAGVAGGRDDGHALLGRNVHRGLAQRGRAAAD